jgi:ABC-type transport system involved in cytochrome c biogenesis ATPase subunit
VISAFHGNKSRITGKNGIGKTTRLEIIADLWENAGKTKKIALRGRAHAAGSTWIYGTAKKNVGKEGHHLS